jgi:hypothetical protein
MITPTQGLTAGPLILAVVALVVASGSIGLHAGASGESSEHTRTSAVPRSTADKPAESRITREARVEGPARRLAPAGDPSGNDVASSIALCPSGTRVVSGGYRTITGGGETFYSDALTNGRVGWAVGAVNKLATAGTVQAFAYCVRSGRAAAGNRRALARQRAAARRQMSTLVDRYKALRAAQF